MAVSEVRLSSDVYFVCLSHALVTEKEEVMGLLIGEIDERRISHINAVIMLRRSDKRKDRVEISPEQLSAASTKAEQLAHQLNKPMRVIGWYHSHPHITVWPSHVDVRTQAMYQMMDEGFIGLIFSVFNEERNSKLGNMQVTCFQSANQSPEGEPPQYIRLEIPLVIVPTRGVSDPCLETLVQLPSILCQEEQESYEKVCRYPLDPITALHNASVFTKSVCHLTEVAGVPLVHMLQCRHRMLMEQADRLQAEKEQLQKLFGPS